MATISNVTIPPSNIQDPLYTITSLSKKEFLKVFGVVIPTFASGGFQSQGLLPDLASKQLPQYLLDNMVIT